MNLTDNHNWNANSNYSLLKTLHCADRKVSQTRPSEGGLGIWTHPKFSTISFRDQNQKPHQTGGENQYNKSHTTDSKRNL